MEGSEVGTNWVEEGQGAPEYLALIVFCDLHVLDTDNLLVLWRKLLSRFS